MNLKLTEQSSASRQIMTSTKENVCIMKKAFQSPINCYSKLDQSSHMNMAIQIVSIGHIQVSIIGIL